jgi:hypothetical protein
MNETTELTPAQIEEEALANTVVTDLAAAYAKASPEVQELFKVRLGPVLTNLTATIAQYQEAEAIYKDIMFPVIEVEAAAA